MSRWISPGQAVTELRSNRIVVLPTETVWGLTCSLSASETLRTLFFIKGRDSSKPAALAFPDTETVKRCDLALWTQGAEDLARAFWPGPLTLVLPGASGNLPQGIAGPDDFVGFRVPDHPECRSVLESCHPLVLTSANISGQNPPSGPFPDGLFSDLSRVRTSQWPGTLSSTVVRIDSEGFEILREGIVPAREIEEALGEPKPEKKSVK